MIKVQGLVIFAVLIGISVVIFCQPAGDPRRLAVNYQLFILDAIKSASNPKALKVALAECDSVFLAPSWLSHLTKEELGTLATKCLSANVRLSGK